MIVLTGTAIVSVLCAVIIAAYVLPAAWPDGIVAIGPGFEGMVVVPTLIGLGFSLVGALAGLIVVARGDRRPAAVLTTTGQLLVWLLIAALLVWATIAPSSGWELIAAPYALLIGQTVVAAGVIVLGRDRLRRTFHTAPPG